jgi:Domain of unknown function (DUF1918)
MDASMGDRIIVDATRLGQPSRQGEVVGVRGTAPTVHYVVRWEDGHESIFYPSSTAHVVRKRSRTEA